MSETASSKMSQFGSLFGGVTSLVGEIVVFADNSTKFPGEEAEIVGVDLFNHLIMIAFTSTKYRGFMCWVNSSEDGNSAMMLKRLINND